MIIYKYIYYLIFYYPIFKANKIWYLFYPPTFDNASLYLIVCLLSLKYSDE